MLKAHYQVKTVLSRTQQCSIITFNLRLPPRQFIIKQKFLIVSLIQNYFFKFVGPVSQSVQSNRPESQCSNDLGSQMDYLFGQSSSNDQSNASTDSSTKDQVESPRPESPNSMHPQEHQTVYSSSYHMPHIVKMDEEKKPETHHTSPPHSSSSSQMNVESHQEAGNVFSQNPQLHPVALGFPNLGNTCYM